MVDYVTRRALRIYEIAEKKPYAGLTTDYVFVLYRIYAVLSFQPTISPADVHNAWCAWQAGIRPDHWYLVPYEALPAHVAAMDNHYALSIALASSEPV